MSRRSSRRPLLSVIVPVYDVAAYLPDCLDSLLAQTHQDLDIVVVDDGSPDDSAAIAAEYADQDERIRLVRTENRGLGAARNEGLRHARGEYLAFADSDDLVPPDAYATLVREAVASEADLVTGDALRLEGDDLLPIGWLRRLHGEPRTIRIAEHPELFGDVFAWNKLYARSFWDRAGLRWPEGVRYEDQPALTEAFARAERIRVVPQVVYHWRIRTDGSSITQQRASVADLSDRWETKRRSLATVTSECDPGVAEVFLDRVLPGDLWRYFRLIPVADDAWWRLLVDGVREFWGERSLTGSILTPVDRLTGWLVEQDRRDDAAAVMRYRAELNGPLPRIPTADGRLRIDVPGLDPTTIDPAALTLRPDER